MLGVILLAIVSMWVWIGERRTLVFKVSLGILIFTSYVIFLQSQGATQDEIWEILFSVDF